MAMVCLVPNRVVGQIDTLTERIAHKAFALQRTALDSLWNNIGHNNHTECISAFDGISSVAAAKGDNHLRLLSDLYRCKVHMKRNEGVVDSLMEQRLLQLIDATTEPAYRFIHTEALQTLANGYFNSKKYALAIRHYIAAHAEYIGYDPDEFPLKADYFYDYGRMYYFFKEYRTAADIFLEAWKTIPEDRLRYSRTTKMNSLALCYRNMDMLDSAKLLYRRAMDMAIADKEDIWVGILSGNIADILVLEGRHDEAIPLLEKNIEVSRRHNDHSDLANTLSMLGEVYRTTGRPELALATQQEAYREFWLRRRRPPASKAKFYPVLARAYADNGQMTEAFRFLDTAHQTLIGIQKEANLMAIAGAQEKFEMEKQKGELERQELVITNQKRFRNVLIAGLLILLCFLWVVYMQRGRITKEKARSHELLKNILPRHTIKEMLNNGKIAPKHFDSVSVLFTDFEDFTSVASEMTPDELIRQLNICFSAFDRIVEKHGLEKIKTIGDSYMAASGIPITSTTHAIDCVKAALDMARCIKAIGGRSFRIRIGIHSGPVVAGIVGTKKFQYDIWGDTVNTASRMESSGEVGRVNISEATYQLVKDHFHCEYRGEIEAKGKGRMGMWFVEEKMREIA
jgi:class 3 adenylate cyclase/tetratricopeptide (TPR) repeat protein